MCGIAGIAGPDAAAAGPRLAAALDRLRHRGPDGEGLLALDGACIGMRRLAIIDLATGDQPIYNEDRSVAVVCNGELYNYVEELPQLERRGHRLQSKSDVNLVPHLYEERGRDAFAALRGMFAIALWDATRRRLVLARDRVGKKPLFWAETRGGLAFASELPALLALLGGTPPLADEAIADYLRLGCIPHPQTVYRGVFALPPGTTLTFEPGGRPEIAPYWSPVEPAPFGGTRDDALAELDTRIREAVALRLRSDVPVGMFLSGGIDSGLVAAYAAELGARDLLCFAVETAAARLNEAPAARATAGRLGLPVEVVPLHLAPVEAVEHVALLYGQPYGDSSAVPSYFVAQAAARHRRVVLNGDGGDEVFAGYRRYWAGLLAPALRPLLRGPGRPLGSLARALLPHVTRRAIAGFALRTLRGLTARDDDAYFTLTNDLLGDADVARYFPGLAALGRTADRIAASRGERERPSVRSLRAFLRSDYRLLLVDDLMVKMDMATMAHSLESRSPLLDVPLAEFTWSLPESWLLTTRESKPLLRAVARRRLPDAVARAPKRGFEVPVDAWLAGPLRTMVGDLLLARDSRVAALGRPAELRRLVEGRDGFPGNRPQTVWALLMLELFLRAPSPDLAPLAGAGPRPLSWQPSTPTPSVRAATH